MRAFTDYPFLFLGDASGKQAPVRECIVKSYDGDKYCKILVDGKDAEVKTGYLYKEYGRCGDAPVINVKQIGE